MALEELITEHFLSQYRVLLDAEDAAFDELEHAYEDGDRGRFLCGLQAWSGCVERRLAFLARRGVPVPGLTVPAVGVST